MKQEYSPFPHANVAQEYPDYLHDESRQTGYAESISFSKSEDDIRESLSRCSEARIPVTVQGARTGITGGAVPFGGHILNLARMNRITALSRRSDGAFVVEVQPGVLLSQLQEAVAKREFDTSDWSDVSVECLASLRLSAPVFFPPDPTETSASIGGMVACNASGARSFFYGSTRSYVEKIRVILMDGSALEVRRGVQKASGRSFRLTTDAGRSIAGSLPDYVMPDVKNAAGYFSMPEMDMIDLFIGSEGTLGVVSSIAVRLIAEPPCTCGVVAFLPTEEDTIRFVRKCREATRPVAIEFFDSRSLRLLRDAKSRRSAFADIPEISVEFHSAAYMEYNGVSNDVDNAVEIMSGIMLECGGSEDATWLADDERSAKKLQAFRHAVPEAVNLLIDERRKVVGDITKLGTDMAVPDDALERVVGMYHRKLDSAGLEYVMFGHIGNNHIHVNILPRNDDEYRFGKTIYLEWAAEVVKMGGTVSAEHGIGKLKVALLREMYGHHGIEQMRAVKKLFDPAFLLNSGNVVGEEGK